MANNLKFTLEKPTTTWVLSFVHLNSRSCGFLQHKWFKWNRCIYPWKAKWNTCIYPWMAKWKTCIDPWMAKSLDTTGSWKSELVGSAYWANWIIHHWLETITSQGDTTKRKFYYYKWKLGKTLCQRPRLTTNWKIFYALESELIMTRDLNQIIKNLVANVAF